MDLVRAKNVAEHRSHCLTFVALLAKLALAGMATELDKLPEVGYSGVRW